MGMTGDKMTVQEESFKACYIPDVLQDFFLLKMYVIIIVIYVSPIKISV